MEEPGPPEVRCVAPVPEDALAGHTAGFFRRGVKELEVICRWIFLFLSFRFWILFSILIFFWKWRGGEHKTRRWHGGGPVAAAEMARRGLDDGVRVHNVESVRLKF